MPRELRLKVSCCVVQHYKGSLKCLLRVDASVIPILTLCVLMASVVSSRNKSFPCTSFEFAYLKTLCLLVPDPLSSTDNPRFSSPETFKMQVSSFEDRVATVNLLL